MTPDVFLFWLLSTVTVCCGLAVVLVTNPVYSALCLVMTMVAVAALFVTLGAYFLAGVQMIVYAGAVMVLFVMVIMLFDLRNEVYAFTRGKMTGALKILCVGSLAGLIVGAVLNVSQVSSGLNNSKETNAAAVSGVASSIKIVQAAGPDAVKSLGLKLFTKYIFAFEALGILLLIIAIGTVALSRSKGGTHAK